MSRRYPETAGMVDFLLDMGKRLSHAVGEGVPEEAKQHLLNAQRELITALVLMYEHQAGTRRAEYPARRAAATRRRPASPAKPSRLNKIPIE